MRLKQFRPYQFWRADQNGAVAIEFGLVALPFFMLVVGLLEISMMFASATVLEGGTLAASRLVRTGQAQESGDAETAFKDALCDNVSAFIPCGSLIFEAIVPPNNTFDGAGDLGPQYDGNGNLVSQGFDAGGVSDVVVMRAAYRYKFITPFLASIFSNSGDNGVTLMSTITIRNEPYEES